MEREGLLTLSTEPSCNLGVSQVLLHQFTFKFKAYPGKGIRQDTRQICRIYLVFNNNMFCNCPILVHAHMHVLIEHIYTRQIMLLIKD